MNSASDMMKSFDSFFKSGQESDWMKLFERELCLLEEATRHQFRTCREDLFREDEKEEEDPFIKAADDLWNEMMSQTSKQTRTVTIKIQRATNEVIRAGAQEEDVEESAESRSEDAFRQVQENLEESGGVEGHALRKCDTTSKIKEFVPDECSPEMMTKIIQVIRSHSKANIKNDNEDVDVESEESDEEEEEGVEEDSASDKSENAGPRVEVTLPEIFLRLNSIEEEKIPKKKEEIVEKIEEPTEYEFEIPIKGRGKDFGPEDIIIMCKVKGDDRSIEVTASREEEDETKAKALKEITRKATIPAGVDVRKIQARMTRDDNKILFIMAKLPK